MAKKVTLYIEDTEIKLLVTKGTQVEKWASLLLEPSLVVDGVIVNEDQVADSIKMLFQLQEVRTKKVVVGLSGLNSIFRVISLPELSQALLPEAVMNEAGRVIPVPLDQVYLSYQPIPAAKGETLLYLVAYPRNSTDALVRTLIKAGLKPEVMDLAPLALCRCADAPRAIIVTSWLTYLDIVIMEDRLPQVIRSLSLPTEAASLEEKLPTITEELNRTIAFYNSSNPQRPLDSSVPVFVSGDLAESPDSWQTLASEHGYPVSALPPPLQFPETFNPFQFMVNMGLALKGQLGRGKDSNSSIVDFNALPDAYRPPAIKLARILVPVAIAVGIGALAYGGLTIQDIGAQTTAIRSQIGGLTSQMNDLRFQNIALNVDITEQTDAVALMPEQVAQVESQLQSVLATQGALEATLTGLNQGLGKTDADLREVVNLLPASITLRGISYEGDMVTIGGLALTEDDIFVYARDLRSSGRFNVVIISSIQETFYEEGGKEIKQFSFDFLLK